MEFFFEVRMCTKKYCSLHHLHRNFDFQACITCAKQLISESCENYKNRASFNNKLKTIRLIIS